MRPAHIEEPVVDRTHPGEMPNGMRSAGTGRPQYGDMAEPTPYQILLRGRPSRRILRPLLDDFTVDVSADSVTSLVGPIGDPSHLHGIVAHLTSVNVEIISIAPIAVPPIHTSTKGTT